MEKSIMLAFVSPVSPFSLNNPINYSDIQGQPYTAIQTNESAIVYVERMLGNANSLAKIFLIASDRVKTEKAPVGNEFGDVTHLEFLQRRIAKEFPHLTDKFSIQDYSEENNSETDVKNNNALKLAKDILQTAQIADAITDFAHQYANAEITVHADMTGGFRHTSMLMLSIIQLLKYRGIKIGEVLYSDPNPKNPRVYSVTEIQRMFSLITGADEFVKFGSVEALNDYFGTNQPPAVNDLLDAMERFSEAIKICRTSTIEDDLANLGQHLRAFRENPDRDLKSELFAKIIDTVERGYGNLIGNTVGRLEIIRWCMAKGFWQQAMTLCTEWLPEELVVRKIYAPTSKTVQNTAALRAITHNKTWQQYFVTDYKFSEKTDSAVANKTHIYDEIRKVLDNFPDKKLSGKDIFGDLKPFLDELIEGEVSFKLCQRGQLRIVAFKENFPKFGNVLQELFNNEKRCHDYRKNFYSFMSSIEYDKIPARVAQLPKGKLLELFKIDPKKSVELVDKSDNKSEDKWKFRAVEYRELFAKKIVRSVLTAEDALKFLRGYYEIRHERNQINHADAKSSKTIADLKPMIETYLAALEKINAAALPYATA